VSASQSAHAEYVPSSSLVPESRLVSKVQAQVSKTARALTRPRVLESHTLRDLHKRVSLAVTRALNPRRHPWQ
jgi:hypothetical protein